MAASTVSSLRYGVLGPFEVTDASGARIVNGRPRQAAVLAILVVHAGEVLSAERLIELLWPDGAPPSAAATLQSYISHLRKTLEPDRPARAPSSVIVSERAGYRLEVALDAIDSAHFQRLATEAWSWRERDAAKARELYEAGLALWRGPALADFAYEEFAQVEIARLEDLRIGVQEELVELRLAAGEHARLVSELEALTAANPLRERLWRQLLVALYRSGRQGDALRAYQRIADQLVDELGVDPSPELRALELAILEHDPALLGPPEPAAAPARAARPRAARASTRTTVGRRDELDRFTAALAEARAGAGSVLLVEGEAGVGKSHLLDALGAAAAEQGALVLRGRCVEGGGAPPLWPWIQVVREWVETSTDPSGALQHLPSLVALADHAPSAAPPASPVVVGHQFGSALSALPSGTVSVVALDDLYGADPDSLVALAEVVDAAAELPVVVIGTYRSASVGDDHPLTELLARSSRLPWVQRLHLDRLDPGSVAALVELVVGAKVPEPMIDEIQRRTDGNALFVVELARLLDNEDDLSSELAPVPPGVRDVIRRRVAHLDPDAVALLGVAAVAGRSFDLDVVAEVAGQPDGLDAVEAALAAQLVEEGDLPGRFRFSHVLVQEAIAESLSATRRARLHQGIDAALERHHGDDPEQWSLIAHHASLAVPVAGPGRALDALGRAARFAFDSGAPALAVQLYDQELAIIAGIPPTSVRDATELAALIGLGRAVTAGLGWGSPRLAEVGERVSELAGTVRDASALLDGLMASYGHYIVTTQIDAADRTVAAMEVLAETSHDPMAVLCANLCAGIDLRYRGRPVEAEERMALAEQVLEQVDRGATGTVRLPPGQQSALSSYWTHRAPMAWMLGDDEAADAHLARAIHLAAVDRSGFGVTFCAMFGAYLGYCRRDHDAVLDLERRYFSEDQRGRFPENDRLASVPFEWARAVASDDPATLDPLTEAVRVAATVPFVDSPMAWTMLADAALGHGRAEDALAAVEVARDHAQRADVVLWLPEIHRLRALVLDSLGRRDEAEAAVDEAARWADETGAFALEARIAATRRQLGLGLG